VTPGNTADDERFTLTTYRYDTNQWILDRPERVLVTDERTNWVKEARFAYDGLGRLTNEMRYLDSGRPVLAARIVYDQYGNARQRTDARGYSIYNDYDPVFHTFPISETVEAGGGMSPLVASAQHDARFGVILRATDFNGVESTVQYDSFGRIVAHVAPGDSAEFPTRSFKYVICDDLRGWTYDYNATGALTLTTNHTPGTIASRVHAYQRERFGQADVIESVVYTDGLGRTISSQIEDEGGFSVLAAARYNSLGGERAKFLPHRSLGGYLPDTNAARTEFIQDAVGRTLKVTTPPDPNGVRHFARTEYLPLKTIAYDFEDTVAGGLHANTPTTTLADGLGRTFQRIEVNQQGAATGNYATTFTYDLRDNLLSVTDAQGNVKTSTYDGLGRKTSTRDPDKGYFQYVYDDVGNLLQTLDAKGQRNTFTYDGANRLLTQDHGSDGVIDVAYHYDSPAAEYADFQNVKGRLGYVVDQSGGSFYSYDARGNLVRTVKRVWRQSGRVEDYVFGSRYDSANRVFEAAFPDGDRVFYQFNRRGLLASVPGLVESIQYHASGQRHTLVLANGDVSRFHYDDRQRLRQLATTTLAAGTVQDLTYDMDGANNMLAMTDGRGLAPADPRNLTQSFALDDLYRLTRATGTGYGTINYSYDKIGNMLSQSSPDIADPRVNHGARMYGGAAGTSNRGGRNAGDSPGPHALSGTANGYAVSYDDNGNMLNARGNVYSWDTLDRLTAVTSTSGTTRFLYDAAGARVLKYTEGNPTNEVVYLSASYEIRQGRAVKFIFAGPVRVARVEGPLPVADRVTQHEVLYPGWNLVPIGVQVTNTSPQSVLATVNGAYDTVCKLHGDTYLTYIPGQSQNSLSNLTAGAAYWIHVQRNNCTLTLTGPRYEAPQVHLDPGWQALVFGGAGVASLPDLAATTPRLAAAWTFDNQFKRFQSYHAGVPAFLNRNFDLYPGQATLFQASDYTTVAMPTLQRKVYYYHEDHLGSGSVVTDWAGNVVEELYYYPFGLLRHRHAAHPDGYHSEYTFTGKEQDAESGLFYFGARYYDPVLCVFISVDPVAMNNPGVGLADSQRLNAYEYCGNNPLVLIDPDGRSWFSKAIKQIGNFLKQWMPTILGIGLSVMGFPVLGALVSSGLSAAMNGGSFKSFATGLAIGAVSGMVAGGITSAVGLDPSKLSGAVIRGGLTGAISGGAAAAVNGGDFGKGAAQGAIVGAITGAVSYGASSYGKQDFPTAVTRTLDVVNDLTWGALQTAAGSAWTTVNLTAGNLYAAISNAASPGSAEYARIDLSYFKETGAVVVTGGIKTGGGAVTLGPFVSAESRSVLGAYMPRATESFQYACVGPGDSIKVLDHELGHVAQSREMGPRFFIEGVRSFAHNLSSMMGNGGSFVNNLPLECDATVRARQAQGLGSR
jgi:RHS repeat-associated protein